MGGKGRTGIGHSKEECGFPEAGNTSGRPPEELPDCASSFTRSGLSGGLVGQEEEEEMDGPSESKEMGRVSFQKKGYCSQDELGLQSLEGRKRLAKGSVGGRGSGGRKRTCPLPGLVQPAKKRTGQLLRNMGDGDEMS